MTAGGKGTYSSGEPKLYFGLGRESTIDGIHVVWPDGSRETYPHVCVDCSIEIIRNQ